MRVRIVSWLWKCPLKECDAVGKKPTAHYLALKRGKYHLRNIHNIRGIYPDFIRFRVGG